MWQFEFDFLVCYYRLSGMHLHAPFLMCVLSLFTWCTPVCLSHLLHFCPLIVYLLTHLILPNVCSPPFWCMSFLAVGSFIIRSSEISG